MALLLSVLSVLTVLLSARSVYVSAATGACDALLSPAYVPPSASFGDVLATLSLAGLANRDEPSLWLNSSAQSWVNEVAVMWPYPQADHHWLSYLTKTKGIAFTTAVDAKLCTLLGYPQIAAAVKGLVYYEDSETLDALKWAAVTAAGLHDGLPVTAAMVASHECLAKLPTVFTLPAASIFSTDLEVYAWAIKVLLPSTSSKVLVGACKNWLNYTCGWGDPLGTATLDFAVSSRAMVVNLSPDRTLHPDQAAVFSTIAAHLEPLGAFSGWAEPESDMVALLSAKDGVVVCGAPNLSFLSAVKVDTAKLPHHRSQPLALNRSKIYLTFQSNEGDTPKNAYSFRGGNW